MPGLPFSSRPLDLMVDAGSEAAKPILLAKLLECPGVLAPRLEAAKPRLFFLRVDPRLFPPRRLVEMADRLGLAARFVEI